MPSRRMLRYVLPWKLDKTRKGAIGGDVSPTVTCSPEIVLFEGYEET